MELQGLCQGLRRVHTRLEYQIEYGTVPYVRTVQRYGTLMRYGNMVVYGTVPMQSCNCTVHVRYDTMLNICIERLA